MVSSYVKRGEIYYADLPEGNGHVQGGTRPVIIISNDVGNKCSPVVIVAPLTTREKKPLPTHAKIKAKSDSMALLEQQTCIDKSRLGSYIGTATRAEMRKLDIALLISVGLNWAIDIFRNNNSNGGEVAFA